MKIIKNFLFLICIMPIFRHIAMEEFTPQERKKTLAALSLEMPKYRNNQQNRARQNFNNLMSTFCPTKGGQSYNFLEELRIEQEELVEEIRNFKMQEELFNLNQDSKKTLLKQEQESLERSKNNLNQVIEQAKEEFKKLEILKKESNIEALKIDHQNQLNALKNDYQNKLNVQEERYKQDCSAFQKKIIDGNQKSLTAITDRQKAELEDLKDQLKTDYQKKITALESKFKIDIEAQKTTLEKEYQVKMVDLDDQKNKNMIDINTLIIKFDAELSQYKTEFENKYKKDHQLSLLQRYPIATLVSGLFFGSFLTGLSMHYNIANNSLDSIATLVEKLFNKTH